LPWLPNRAPNALDNGSANLAADYRTPFAVHTPLEPQAALANFNGDKLEVWITTQDAGGTQSTLAEALGLEKENIDVMPTYVGGGFGRKLGTPGAIAAARLVPSLGQIWVHGAVHGSAMMCQIIRPQHGVRHYLPVQVGGARSVCWQILSPSKALWTS